MGRQTGRHVEDGLCAGTHNKGINMFQLVLCLLAVATVGLFAYGAKRRTGTMRTLTRRLEAARLDDRVRPLPPARFNSREPSNR